MASWLTSGSWNANSCALFWPAVKIEMGRDAVNYASKGLAWKTAGNAWESWPCPIVADVGASTSVMPISWCTRVGIHVAEVFKRGVFYIAGYVNTISNGGERRTTMMSQEGVERNMRFQVCDVERPLASMSQFCKSGQLLVFNLAGDSRGPFMEHRNTVERTFLESQGGVYVLSIKMAPRSAQAFPFGGQGQWPAGCREEM